MKNLSHLTFLTSALVLAACSGPGSKTPVSDIEDIRNKSSSESGYKPGAPREIPKYIDREVEVKVEQATLNESYIKIEIDKKDNPIRFFENSNSKVKFYLRVLDPKLKMNLTAKDLPTGATLKDVSTAADPGAYELSWKPALYTVPFSEESPKLFVITLVPVVDKTKTPATKVAVVEKLFLEKAFSLSVFRTQEKPSELTVSGLSEKIEEGQVLPFSVVARIPGLDENSPQKPTIGIFKDSVVQVAGTNYREMNGSRYVTVDESRAEVEYLGDFKWKFNLAFDTKNIPVEAQKAKDGSALANSDMTRVRFAMKVYGPFTATNASIVQIAIKRLSTAETK